MLASLSFADRLRAASVCKSWKSIVNSAAPHDRAEDSTAGGCSSWDLTRFQPCDVCALEEQQQYRLHLCKALCYAGSASVWMCAVGGTTMRQLQGLTRLHLLDIRCDVEGRQFSPPVRSTVSLQHLQHLRILNLGMSSPMVDFTKLPSSLECLHLNLASGGLAGPACLCRDLPLPMLPCLMLLEPLQCKSSFTGQITPLLPAYHRVYTLTLCRPSNISIFGLMSALV